MKVETIEGTRMLRVPAQGTPLGTERDALDLIGATYGQEVDMIAIPIGRLHPDFLRLSTRMAGEFLQKMQNYGFRVAFVGDISTAIAQSDALRDFVRESNRIGRIVFVPDESALLERLRAS